MESQYSMDTTLRQVTDWLVCASSQIEQEYMQLPVAGQEDPQYRERVYCYELYHCWRCHWPSRFPYSLSGEIDKTGHPIIRGGPKPDFLVHVPGRMKNLLAMEVKPPNAAIDRMVDDLVKLTTFRRSLGTAKENYHAGFFWIYGMDNDGWQEFRSRLLKGVAKRADDIDLSLVSCFVHAQAGCCGYKVDWE